MRTGPIRMEARKPAKARTDEAATWLLKTRSNDLTDADRASFAAWLKSSSRNVAAIIAIMAIENDLRSRILKRPRVSRPNIIEFDFRARQVADPKEDHDRTIARTMARLALSSTYLEKLRKKNRPAKLLLSGISVIISIATVLGSPTAQHAMILSVGFLVILVLKELVVGYRISHGLFGNTASEARELLRFLITNAETIDFDDHNGKPRPVFERGPRSCEPPVVPTGVIVE